MVAVGSRKATVTLPADDQILIVREFNASKELVFKAWTTPELVAQWWTAKRGSMTVTDIDLRVGGKWRWVMVTGDGLEVAFHGEYKEIAPYDKLVSTEAFEGAPDPDDNAGLNDLTLTEVDGVTTAHLLSTYPNKFIRDMVIESGMEEGMQDAFDLMEEAVRRLM